MTVLSFAVTGESQPGINCCPCYNGPMSNTSWPDLLQPAQPAQTAHLLEEFWRQLASLPDLIGRSEHILAAACIGEVRQIVLRLMLALNGIACPEQTRHLNSYLSASQRQALEKTLALPVVGAEGWIGQAVALVVIYRWYAPQLVTAYGLPPLAALETLEQQTLALLQAGLPDWPLSITTE